MNDRKCFVERQTAFDVWLVMATCLIDKFAHLIGTQKITQAPDSHCNLPCFLPGDAALMYFRLASFPCAIPAHI
jgi:hypothetical protein